MKNNAWKVEFRTGPKQDWLTDVTFPAIDLVEIDGQHQEEPMDLGELRAQAHAAYTVKSSNLYFRRLQHDCTILHPGRRWPNLEPPPPSVAMVS
jgi:hypothetical protein